MRYLACFILLFCSSLWSYELAIIQSVSDSGRTFITRTGKKDGIVPGKKSTFTSDNVSVIAKAVSVTREFTQWEIQNTNTPTPFKRGEMVTYYDATEYLWALSPAQARRKYIKSEVFQSRLSLGAHLGIFRGLNASVSDAADNPEQRGGLIFEGMLEKEMTRNIALAAGLRYSREIINVAEASLTTNQALALAEARYYFDPIRDFYSARFAFALGAGYGQSQTSTSGLTSAGTATLLPSTKVSLNFPVDKKSDFVLEGAFESLRVEEEFEDGSDQSTNTNNLRYGIAFKRYLD